MSIIKKIEISVLFAIIVSVLFSLVSFAQASDEISKKILRLHVIANSDSAIDQKLKLDVRDIILKEGNEIFDGSVNIDNAYDKILPEIERLTNIAQSFITERGFNYKVRIELKEEYFTTRKYDYVTLPAGEYLALRVIIGTGEGHNWWCVMFPPMCLSAANEEKAISSVLTARELDVVNRNPKYEPRFKILEIYENIKQHFIPSGK